MGTTLNCNGSVLDLTRPKIIGIVNLTPDSFYDGGQLKSDKAILEKVGQHLIEGASIIDIGAYSSRPDAVDISPEKEINRLKNSLKRIKNEFPEAIISLDTFRSEVAEMGIEHGVAIINDISGGILDKKMIPLVAKYKKPYIIMHMPGTPQTMMAYNQYRNIITEIEYFFSKQIKRLSNLGVNDIILDVGFGFGKDINQNFELLNALDFFNINKKPLLIGISRKSMVYKTLKVKPEDALNGTTALNMVALEKGARLLRVHDVKQAKQCVMLHEKLNQFGSQPSI